MKLEKLASKPQLIKLIIDDAEIIEEFGEPLEFWTWDRQPIDVSNFRYNPEEEPEEDEEENEETANKFVRYYCPAYDGLPGFIGKFGESIIDAPTESQAKFLIQKFGQEKFNGRYKYGAKEFLLRKRRKLSGAALEEEIREMQK
jgi:hypothetical protein